MVLYSSEVIVAVIVLYSFDVTVAVIVLYSLYVTVAVVVLYSLDVTVAVTFWPGNVTVGPGLVTVTVWYPLVGQVVGLSVLVFVSVSV